MNINVGKKIKELRTARSMTQADLAKRIGMTTSAVSSYEVNDRQPSYDVLIKISKQFNVTTDYLLGLIKHNDNDMVSVSGLCIAQRESVERMIETYQKLNAVSIMVFDLEQSNNVDSEMDSLHRTSIESFIMGVKSRIKK